MSETIERSFVAPASRAVRSGGLYRLARRRSTTAFLFALPLLLVLGGLIVVAAIVISIGSHPPGSGLPQPPVETSAVPSPLGRAGGGYRAGPLGNRDPGNHRPTMLVFGFHRPNDVGKRR